MQDDKYTYSITQTGYIINSLSDDVKNRIPQGVVNFFNTNSDMSLISNENDRKNMFENFTDDTLKFLKVIDYYINNSNPNIKM